MNQEDFSKKIIEKLNSASISPYAESKLAHARNQACAAVFEKKDPTISLNSAYTLNKSYFIYLFQNFFIIFSSIVFLYVIFSYSENTMNLQQNEYQQDNSDNIDLKLLTDQSDLSFWKDQKLTSLLKD
jgi:large-conductance mechanosensitive channel